MRRHFHSVAVETPRLADIEVVRRGPSPGTDAVAVRAPWLAGIELRLTDSLLIYANHASWWDPLTAILISPLLFPGFPMYAPIDAEALSRYRMFARMGFFPVERNSLRGAASFSRVSRHILSQPGNSLWLTPEGRFADVRDGSAPLQPGLGHLAARLQSALFAERVWFIPAAVEYVFWEERLPELLIRIGEPVDVKRGGGPQGKAEWQELLTQRLRDTQRSLAEAVISRDAERFEPLLSGSGGTFAVYDAWRAIVRRLTGERVDSDHGNKLRSRK